MICLRHLIRSRAVTNRTFFLGKKPIIIHACAIYSELPSYIRSMGWRNMKILLPRVADPDPGSFLDRIRSKYTDSQFLNQSRIHKYIYFSTKIIIQYHWYINSIDFIYIEWKIQGWIVWGRIRLFLTTGSGSGSTPPGSATLQSQVFWQISPAHGIYIKKKKTERIKKNLKRN